MKRVDRVDWDENRITGTNDRNLVADLHATLPGLHVVHLFQAGVPMGWDVLPWLEGLLGEAEAAEAKLRRVDQGSQVPVLEILDWHILVPADDHRGSSLRLLFERGLQVRDRAIPRDGETLREIDDHKRGDGEDAGDDHAHPHQRDGLPGQ